MQVECPFCPTTASCRDLVFLRRGGGGGMFSKLSRWPGTVNEVGWSRGPEAGGGPQKVNLKCSLFRADGSIPNTGISDRMSLVCDKCKRSFTRLSNLNRHKARKNPCTPAPAQPSCSECKRAFSTKTAMYRHRRAGTCATKDLAKSVSEIRAQVATLTAAAQQEGRIVASQTNPGIAIGHLASQTFNHSPVTTNTYYTINNWDGKERLVVSFDLLKAAFRENELLREYCSLPEVNRSDPTFVNTYVLEALMAVIRQAHRSPGCQNIRLNPDRADQVQVLMREGGERWEILTLVEAVRLLFRDAAGHIERLACTAAALQELTPAERTATYTMPTEYRRHPEKYEREGKGRLAAHLAALQARPAPPQERLPVPLAGAVPQPAPPLMPGPELLPERPSPPLGPPHPEPEPEQPPPSARPESLTVPAEARPVLRRPPPFSPAIAAALLREHPPALDDDDRAPPDTLQRLSELSGQDPSRIINHLWDAKEEGLLTAKEQTWAAALTRQFDGVD